MARRGKLILIVGPTGSGKGTLMKHALARFPEVLSPHSYTTRNRRSDAIENAHYEFITVEEFTQKIEQGAFLEWAEFSGNFYGTLRAEVEQGLEDGRVMFKEMEVQGVRQARALLPKSELITLFIEVGSWEELKRRAQTREPMSEEVLEKRRLHYDDEVRFMPEADVIVPNFAGKYEEAEAIFEGVIEQALKDTQDS